MQQLNLNMPINTKFNCRFCGIVITSKIGRGRPRQFCSDSCRDGKKYLEAFYRISDKTNFTEDQRKTLRGDLLTFMNQTLPTPIKSKLGTKITPESFCKDLDNLSKQINGSLQ